MWAVWAVAVKGSATTAAAEVLAEEEVARAADREARRAQLAESRARTMMSQGELDQQRATIASLRTELESVRAAAAAAAEAVPPSPSDGGSEADEAQRRDSIEQRRTMAAQDSARRRARASERRKLAAKLDASLGDPKASPKAA